MRSNLCPLSSYRGFFLVIRDLTYQVADSSTCAGQWNLLCRGYSVIDDLNDSCCAADMPGGEGDADRTILSTSNHPATSVGLGKLAHRSSQDVLNQERRAADIMQRDRLWRAGCADWLAAKCEGLRGEADTRGIGRADLQNYVVRVAAAKPRLECSQSHREVG